MFIPDGLRWSPRGAAPGAASRPRGAAAAALGLALLLAPSARASAGAAGAASNATKTLPRELLAALRETTPSPTNQPPTRGQDEQKCGFMLLPDRVTLSSDIPDWLGLSWSGPWSSMDGGTFATWYQNFFRWVQPSFSVFVDSKLMFRMESLGDEGRLAPGEDVLYREPEGTGRAGGFHAHAMTDCQNDVMYVIGSHADCTHKIYDRFGSLVAESYHPEHPFFKDSVLFEDENKKPIAVAMSPMIIDTKMYSYGMPEPNRHWEPGRPNTWQIWYFTGKTTDHGLRIAQNRWVIAAAIQQCALNDALSGVSGEHLSSHLWIVGICVRLFYVLFPLMVLGAALLLVHRWFFASSRKQPRNVFFREDSQGYGTVGQAEPEMVFGVATPSSTARSATRTPSATGGKGPLGKHWEADEA